MLLDKRKTLHEVPTSLRAPRTTLDWRAAGTHSSAPGCVRWRCGACACQKRYSAPPALPTTACPWSGRRLHWSTAAFCAATVRGTRGLARPAYWGDRHRAEVRLESGSVTDGPVILRRGGVQEMRLRASVTSRRSARRASWARPRNTAAAPDTASPPCRNRPTGTSYHRRLRAASRASGRSAGTAPR